MAGAIRTFTGSHSAITGFALIVVGLLGVYGSLTGFLPSMLAALFDKTALAPNPGVGTSPSAVIPGKAGGGGAGGEGTAPALPSGQSPPELTPGITIPELPA